MHYPVLIRCLPFIAALWLFGGCATRQARLEKNAELLGRFTAEEQASIREGKIDVGFNKDMVFLAWGKPNRVSTRVTEAEQNEIWTYTGYRTRFAPGTGYYFGSPYFGHARHCHGYGYWPLHVTPQEHQEYDKMKVVFAGDKVVSYESVN